MTENELKPEGNINPESSKKLAEQLAEIQSERETLPAVFDEATLDIIRNVKGPIVEVGGHAHEILPSKDILPSEPITSDVGLRRHSEVALLADGKQLPFADNSIALFMADHISNTDLLDANVRAYIDSARNRREFFKRQDQAGKWSDQEYTIFASDPNAAVRLNLRINFMKEMKRAVEPGGLMLFGHISANDIVVATELGWEVVQKVPTQQDTYNCLFRMAAEK